MDGLEGVGFRPEEGSVKIFNLQGHVDPETMGIMKDGPVQYQNPAKRVWDNDPLSMENIKPGIQ
jgi:hypothetical protein